MWTDRDLNLIDIFCDSKFWQVKRLSDSMKLRRFNGYVQSNDIKSKEAWMDRGSNLIDISCNSTLNFESSV